MGLEIQGETGAKPDSLPFLETEESEGRENGCISSTTYSPALRKNIAMALLKNGKNDHGKTARAVNFVSSETRAAKVVQTTSLTPKGVRQNG